jgi:hypothetical protein
MPVFCFDYLDWKNGLIHTREQAINIRVCVFVVNIVITPFVLVGHSIYVYLIPCISGVLTNILCRILFTSRGCLSLTSGFLFTDSEFPPEARSIGNVKLKHPIKWKRARDIVITKHQKNSVKGAKPSKLETLDKLFEDGIDAADICQGQLGDCWLLSALAGNSFAYSVLGCFPLINFMLQLLLNAR